ncbi:helix-turn-helix transcriptional regulator [Streptomyces sp. NPDC054784]
MHHPPPDDTAWLRHQQALVGRRVRDARLWADLTQERLSEASGVERTTLQRIEAGSTDARLSWLLQIARACRVPLADLMTDNRPPPVPPPP